MSWFEIRIQVDYTLEKRSSFEIFVLYHYFLLMFWSPFFFSFLFLEFLCYYFFLVLGLFLFYWDGIAWIALSTMIASEISKLEFFIFSDRNVKRVIFLFILPYRQSCDFMNTQSNRDFAIRSLSSVPCLLHSSFKLFTIFFLLLEFFFFFFFKFFFFFFFFLLLYLIQFFITFFPF